MRIDVVSDMVCPWCYLGKRRLEAALSRRLDIETEVHWLPFELNPAMPEGGLPRDEYLAPKIGGLEAMRAAQDRLTALGAAEGVEYRFDLVTKSPNTRAAHALARIAAGISAVPFFILDRRVALSGAQETAAFERALEELRPPRGEST